MNKMEFTFDYSVDFDTLYVKTEKCPLMVEGHDSEKLEIVGHFEMKDDVNYAFTDENIVSIDTSDRHISIDSSDIEEELANRDIDFKQSLLLVKCPAGKEVRIESELGRIKVKGLTGKLVIDSEIGGIIVKKSSASMKIDSEVGSVQILDTIAKDVKCRTEVGGIIIKNIKADNLDVSTEVGMIDIAEAEVSEVNLASETGNIEYKLLPTIKHNHSKIDTEIGKVKIVLPQELAIDLTATSEMGTVSSFLKNVENIDVEDGVKVVTTGLGQEEPTCRIEVETEIGNVTLLNEDTDVKSEFKKSFKADKITKEIDKAMQEVNKATKILSSPGFRKVMGSAFSNLGETIKNGIQSALQETDVTIKESMKDMKENFHKESEVIRQQAEDIKKDKESIRKIVRKKKFLDDPAPRGMSEKERSRLKVLELLEDGKINQEEAEQLLKVIGK